MVATALTMRLMILPMFLLAVSASAQTLPARPVVTVGGAMSNANDELVKVTAARRLPDGRIVVAIRQPIELRVYDPSGTLTTRIGRKGGGPGEFRAAVSIPYADNDSIVTFTDYHNRYQVFTPAGKLVHEYEVKDTPAVPALLHRAVLLSPNSVVNGCARAVMMALPLVTPANLYEVIPDRSGHLWAHALHSRDWRVYSQAGPFLGTITLPLGVRVLDVGANWILVHSLDSDDIEQVVEYRVNVPAGALNPPCATRRDAFPLVSDVVPRVAELKQAVRDAIAAHEVFWSNHAHYAKTKDSLQLKLPAGTVFQVIEAGNNGHAAAVLDTRSTLVCVVRIAEVRLPWPDGKTFCGN